MAIALVGGGAFTDAAAAVDADLLAASGAGEVLVIPAAAAFEHPERQVAAAVARFAALGATARGLPVFGRADAQSAEVVAALVDARFVYITSGSPMHLRSVLKGTPLWDALRDVHERGGLVAADAEAATVVTDPMTDPRGGAFTIGLGLVAPLAVLARHETWSPERSRRTRELAPRGICVANLDTGGALVRDADGWRALGQGAVSVYVDDVAVGLERLP